MNCKIDMRMNVGEYNSCADICRKGLNRVMDKIKGGERDITKLMRLGNDLMNEELRRLNNDYNNKKEHRLCVAFPTSISVNNCVGGYIYEIDNDAFNKIREGDVVKIEMGVNLNGSMVHFGETLVINKQSDTDPTYQDKYIRFLDDLERALCKVVKGDDMTNDDVRQFIEGKCTEAGCFPVENTFSYQLLNGEHRTDESKWIVLNHKKYWDENDELAVDENLCFDIEPDDIYNINITIVPSTDDEHVYSERHLPHIYRFNDFFYNLRLKSSREFLNKVKGKHSTNWFDLGSVLQNDPKNKIGFRECFNNGLMEAIPVLYHKEGLPVYTKKLTLFVDKTGSKRLSLKSKNLQT